MVSRKWQVKMNKQDNLVRRGRYDMVRALDYLMERSEFRCWALCALTVAEGHGHCPVELKDAGQAPKPFSASVPTSAVKNAASFAFSQSCKYICDHACVSGIHGHVCYWLDPQMGMRQPRPSARWEAPAPWALGWAPAAGQECPSWPRALGEGSRALPSLNALLQVRFQLAHLLIFFFQ